MKEELIKLYKSTPNCIEYGDFTLNSGAKSKFYIDSKQITLTAKGLQLIGNCFLNLAYLFESRIDAIGGMEFGASPIVSALLSQSPVKDLRGFIIRKANKDHGKKDRIAGPLRSEDKVLLVEDVTTTGKALLECIDIVQSKGCKVVGCLSIIDRGGSKAIDAKGIPFASILIPKDIGIEE